MFQISTVYQGEKYTLDLHNLIIETDNSTTYCHRLNREDLYKALVKLKCPGIQPFHGHQDLCFRYGVWQQKKLAETVK